MAGDSEKVEQQIPTARSKQWGGGETTGQMEEEASFFSSKSLTKRHISGPQRLPSNSRAGKLSLERTR